MGRDNFEASWEGIILREGHARHLRQHSAVSCAKMGEPIEMPFGLWTRVSRMKWWQCGLMSNYFEHLLYFAQHNEP